MPLNQTTSGGDTALWKIIVGFVIYLLVEPVRSPWRRIEGIDGVITVVLALPATLFWAVFPLSAWLASQGWPWGLHALAGLIGGALVFAYAVPALWRWLVHPVVRLSDAIIDRAQTLLRQYTDKVTGGLVRVLGKVMPWSGKLWDKVIKADDRPFIASAVGFIATGSALAGSAYLAWLAYHQVDAFILQHVQLFGIGHALGVVLALLAAIAVGITLGGISWQLLKYGKLPLIAEVSGGLTVYAAFGKISALAGSPLWTSVCCAVAYVAFVSYIFPGFIRAFSGKLWAKIFDKLEKLTSAVYDERDSTFRYFSHHVMTAIATALAAWAAYAVGTSLELSWYCVYPLVGLVAFSTYDMIFEATDHEGGNIMFGLAISLTGAYAAARAYIAHGLVLGVWGGLITGVLAGLLLVAIVVPLVYIAFKKSLLGIGKLGLEAPVSAAFNSVNGRYLAGQKRMNEFVDEAYDDHKDDAYRQQFLHVANILVAAAAWWLTQKAVAFFAVSPGWSLADQILAPAVSYLFLGRLMLKSSYGVPFVSIMAGLIRAVIVGSVVWSLGTGLDIHVGAGVAFALTWAASVFVYFPPIYAGVRALTESWTIKWLGPSLAYIYGKLWIPVGWFYDGAIAGFKWVGDVLRPVWKIVASWVAAGAKAYNDFLALIRGRR